jgi:hypothetical protein
MLQAVTRAREDLRKESSPRIASDIIESYLSVRI